MSRHETELAAMRTALAASGRRFWRGLDDPALHGALEDLLGDEFASFRQAASGTDRREFLRVMAASLALAGIAGCSPQRSEDAIPYVVQPEEVVPGKPSLYASAVTFEGFAQPVLAWMHRGRPTKLEGNPEHPAVLGRTDLFTQAAILDLYDPDRSPQPLQRGEPTTLAAFDRLLPQLRAEWRRTGGEGLRLLFGQTTSPTVLRQLASLATAYPRARVHVFQPVGTDLRREATRLAFGRPVDLLPRLDRAKVVVSLDDDLLGPGPQQVWNTRHWASRRGSGADRIVLWVAECTPTQTGAVADRRLAAAASRMGALAAALAARLGLPGWSEPPDLRPAERDWIDGADAALRRHAGRSLVTAGATAPPDVQALALAINGSLGNAGTTLGCVEAMGLVPGDKAGDLVELVRDLRAGVVRTLFVIGSNPVHSAPADLGFADALARATLVVHADTHADETAASSDWHLPLPHALESWSDARAIDGTLSIIQPLILPLYASRSPHELLRGLTEDRGASALDIVQDTWRERFGAEFEARWRRALHDGFVADTASPALDLKAAVPTAPTRSPSLPDLEVVFRPDPTIWDGRFGNNSWLQELPKPLTKTTWENVVLVSPKMADANAIGNGDRVRVETAGRAVEGPAWIMPGQAEATVTLFFGYGRRRGGQVCEGIGYDANRVRASVAPWTAAGSLTKLEGPTLIATTQTTQAIDGDDFVRVVPPGRPDARREEDRNDQTIYPEWPRGRPAWGMVIDLDLCTGCNACTIACQAENNVPVVGKEQVARGRHMHWLRIDRYYTGEIEAPQSHFQPVPCMHCEQAPCEMGCPVHATVHGPDGLNQMVYNRCIGTRTCSSFCPYKVRRFNWFDFTSGAAEAVMAQRNPDVTVRGRGVMEKCTYCVQRLRGAQVEADKENRPVRDGEVETACQGACPSRAITFGDIADPESRAARARADTRNYALLGHLGTRPRTTYLAKIAPDPGEGP